MTRENNLTIKIVDAIPGAGKTSAAINYINENPDKRFLYVTPYLTEVDRISKNCKFREPVKYTEDTPKIIDLKNLLSKGKNVVTTHALFHLFDDEVIDLCYDQNYILILDEVTDVVETYPIAKGDLETLLEKYVSVREDGILVWTGDTDTEKFRQEYELCQSESLALYLNVAVIRLFPVKIFKAFRESYILTYLFDAQIQKYYYDYYNLNYENLFVRKEDNGYFFSNDRVANYAQYNFGELVNIIEDEKLNLIGDSETSLSKGWFERNKDNGLMVQLRNNTINFFNNKKVKYTKNGYISSSSNDNIWTTFKDYQKSLAGKGYTKGFLSCNLRATNEYRDRTVIAYLMNRYLNPVIKNFFNFKGVTIDEEKFALSELLQFLWRSGIRDGKPITVYIPSSRMRRILKTWIKNCTL